VFEPFFATTDISTLKEFINTFLHKVFSLTTSETDTKMGCVPLQSGDMIYVLGGGRHLTAAVCKVLTDLGLPADRVALHWVVNGIHPPNKPETQHMVAISAANGNLVGLDRKCPDDVCAYCFGLVAAKGDRVAWDARIARQSDPNKGKAVLYL
jgi:hypothetical protein